MLSRFIAILAAVHAVAFLVSAAVLQSLYLLLAAAFMVAVLGGAILLGRRARGPKQR